METPWRTCPEHGEYKRFGDGGCQRCGKIGRIVPDQNIADAFTVIRQAGLSGIVGMLWRELKL